jgi:hypothetical protein
MSAEDFFRRWSRRKGEAETARGEEQPAAAHAGPAPPQDLPAPTMEDVGALEPESDFSRFMKRDVDETVRRSAMKKLFSDPHFNVMDGLDIYIDDYNKFEPLPETMVALLEHAKPLFNPLAQPGQAPQPEQPGAADGSILSEAELAAEPEAELEAAPEPQGVTRDAAAANLETPSPAQAGTSSLDSAAPQDGHSI